MIKKQDFSKNMKLYVGNKIIKAEPMTKFDYNILRGKDIPGDNQDGYCVGYFDSMDKIDEEPNYYSWSPKPQFEESYRKTTGLNFGIALELMKKGYSVARKGWNEKNMFVYMQRGMTITKEMARNDILKNIDGDIKICDHIDMRAADGSIVISWLANQTDMLSEDWVIVK